MPHDDGLIRPDEIALFHASLERSRRRRRGLSPEARRPAEGGPRRDLSDPEFALESLRRALLRRRAAEQRGALDRVPVRKVAATAAITGALATAGEPLVQQVSSPPSAQAATRALVKQGDSGDAVRRLQRGLGITADGIFGPATERAVIRFQRRHRLAADGIVGPATWGALGARATRAGASTSEGGAVARLQRALGITADGAFGPQTEEAVKRFQSAHGLTADGIVGPATWAALGASGPVLKRGGEADGAGPVARAIAGANRIAHMPYRYGGGHGSFTDTGYDCSGAVSYVLHAAGALSRPLDSTGLMSYGAAGPGAHITVYARPGHSFMTIDGRRFDTTGRETSGSFWQPAGRSTVGYTVRHPPGL